MAVMIDLCGSSANTENLLRIHSGTANRLKETVHPLLIEANKQDPFFWVGNNSHWPFWKMCLFTLSKALKSYILKWQAMATPLPINSGSSSGKSTKACLPCFLINGFLTEVELDGADCLADLVDFAGGRGAFFFLSNSLVNLVVYCLSPLSLSISACTKPLVMNLMESGAGAINRQGKNKSSIIAVRQNFAYGPHTKHLSPCLSLCRSIATQGASPHIP